MITKLFYLNFWFSRSRLRKGPKIEEKLKDFSTLHAVKKQIKEYRSQFETKNIKQTFTQVLQQKKPVLGQRFKVDHIKLSNELKKRIRKQITPQSLVPSSENQDDLKYLNQSKSYLNDQRVELQFQEKFKKEMFMKKETNRMLKKEENKFVNFLPQNKDNKFNKYLEAKTKLKNSRIQSMMNYKRNNTELQLLIESGFMDEPENLKALIQKMNYQNIPKITGKNQKLVTSLVTHNDQTNQSQKKSLEQTMMRNVEGPKEIRDFSKIEEFIDSYNTSSEQSKRKAAQDVDLLLQVREYQRNLFLSRYDQINFRFKGRVKFNNFKEYQLLSYIKTQDIPPMELLLLFDQNKELINRFNLPIITPAVMSRIYAKTSTYLFSENDENNRVNLLNDPIFKRLESSLFRELDKINDELFCDAVWAYSRNHEQEEGVLNIKKSDAIQMAIFRQMTERMSRLREEDLGLLMRAMIKLNLLKQQEYTEKWGEVVQVLQNRLPLVKQGYEYESIMQFMSLLPVTSTTVNTLAANINYFKKYEWKQRAPLLTFTRVSSALLNNHQLLDPFQHNKSFIIVKQVLVIKKHEILSIIPTLTINQMSQIMIAIQSLNKIPFGPNIPQIIVNITKKQIVSSIQTQKDKIYQYTLSTLITSLSVYDYYQNIIKKQSKYIDRQILLQPYNNTNILKIVTLKHLLPGRVFTFNSQLYFVYHEMARLIQVEESNLSTKSLSDSLFGLSLVQYKHQGTIDTLAFRILGRVEKEQKQRQNGKLTLNETVNLMKVVNGYSLQRRLTDVIEQIFDNVIKNGKQHFKSVQLNILISFFGSYVNLFTQPTEQPKQNENIELKKRWERNKNVLFGYLYCFKNYISPFLQKLQVQELITLYFIESMIFNNIQRIIQKNQKLSQQYQILRSKSRKNIEILLNIINNKENLKINNDYRFIISLCKELNKLSLQITQTSQCWGQFQKIQKLFFDKHMQNILTHEQHVGANMSYIKIADKITAKLINQAKMEKGQPIKQKIWRIEDLNKKTVYFFATFEHLMSKFNGQTISMGLFGFWRVYSQLYRRKGWKFELICTILQK